MNMMSANNKQQQVLKMAVSQGVMTPEAADQAEKAAASSGRPLFEVLTERKAIDPEAFSRVLSQIYGMQYTSLLEKNLTDKVLYTIPIEVAENYKIICFEKADFKDESRIKVGIVDPSNFKALEAMSFLAREHGFLIEYFVISEISFAHAFKQYSSLKKEVLTALSDKINEQKEEEQQIKEDKTEEVIKSAPIAKIVSVIIRHAIEGNASDIHIEPMQKECRVRYRIDGVLHTSLSLPKEVHDSLIARIKVLANMKLDETRIPQDGRMHLVSNNKEFDFRVSVLPLVGTEKAVLRILDTGKGAPSLEELGYSNPGLETIKRNIKDTTGIFLVTGPTGSGKSTTLFSFLNELNKDGTNICTLEDPVEYYVKGVNQSQIRPEIGYTFATGLRSLLRQDPDIIMVGEIRDNETAELAIHSALTGHFILSTLHTNDAVGAIPRLIDMKVEPFLLVSTLNTIIAQRLARRICQNCRVEEDVPAGFRAEIKKELDKINEKDRKQLKINFDIDKAVFYKGKGCPRCGNSGFLGRIAVYEVIEINEQLKDVITNKKRFTEEDVSSSQLFINMKQDGFIKALSGITSVDEIMRVLQD